MPINDGGPAGGPAFPVAFMHHHPDGSAHSQEWAGMTLRDYFAAKAMQALIINPDTTCATVPLSARAYEIADKMLARRTE